MQGIFINHEVLRGATAQKIRWLARDLGVNEIHLGRKINGRAKLKIEDLNAICARLGRDVRDFILFEEIDRQGKLKTEST